MLAANGNSQYLCEPLVFISFFNFCRLKEINVAKYYWEKFVEEMNRQNKGRLLELFVAVSLYEGRVQNRLVQLVMDANTEGEGTVQLPKDGYKGILVGVSLTPQLLSNFGECEGNHWILLPTQLAGPDIIASPFIISCKFTTEEFVRAEECAKAIRTVTPSRWYRKNTSGKEKKTVQTKEKKKSKTKSCKQKSSKCKWISLNNLHYYFV